MKGILNLTTKKKIYSYINNLSTNRIDLVRKDNGISIIEFYNIYDLIDIKKKRNTTLNHNEVLDFSDSYDNLLYKLKQEINFIDSAREAFINYFKKECKRKKKDPMYRGDSIYGTDEYVSYIKNIRRKKKQGKQISEIEHFYYSECSFFDNPYDRVPLKYWLTPDLRWRIENKIYGNYHFLDFFINNLLFIDMERLTYNGSVIYSIDNITVDEKEFMLFLYGFEYFFFRKVLNMNNKEGVETIININKAFELTLNTLRDVLGIDLLKEFYLHKEGLKEDIKNPLLQYILFYYYTLRYNLVDNFNFLNCYNILAKNSNLLITSESFNFNKLEKVVDGIIYLNRNIYLFAKRIKPIPTTFRYMGYIKDNIY